MEFSNTEVKSDQNTRENEEKTPGSTLKEFSGKREQQIQNSSWRGNGIQRAFSEYVLLTSMIYYFI